MHSEGKMKSTIRNLALLLLLVFAILPLSPLAQDMILENSWASFWDGQAFSFADGDILWHVCDESGLKVLDITNPEVPNEITSHRWFRHVKYMDRQGDILYGVSEHGIRTLNVADPRIPEYGVQYHLFDETGEYRVTGLFIQCLDSIAVVGYETQNVYPPGIGYQLVDISNPDSLTTLAWFPDIYPVSIQDNIMIASPSRYLYGVYIVDIADLFAPEITYSFQDMHYPFYDGSYLFITSEDNFKVGIYDIMDLHDPLMVCDHIISSHSGTCRAVQTVNNTLIVHCGISDKELISYDIRHPESPILINSIEVEYNWYYGATKRGNYIINKSCGMYNTTVNMVVIGNEGDIFPIYDYHSRLINNIFIRNDILLVDTGYDELKLVDYSDYANPRLINRFKFEGIATEYTYHLMMSGNLGGLEGYVQNQYAIFDMRNWNNIQHIETINGEKLALGDHLAWTRVNDYLRVCEYSDECERINYDYITLCEGQNIEIFAADTLAFVIDESEEYQIPAIGYILSYTNDTIQVVSTFEIPYYPYSIYFGGMIQNYALFCDYNSSSNYLLDLSDINNPVLRLAEFPSVSDPIMLYRNTHIDDTTWLATQARTIYIVDMHDPLHPVITGEWTSTLPNYGSLLNIVANDEFAFVSNSASILCLDYTDPLSVSDPLSLAQIPDEQGLIRIYPNPFNTAATVQLNITTPGWYRGKVYDVLGREVAQVLESRLVPGEHSFTFQATGMASGVYLLQLSGPDGVASAQRITVLK